MSDESTLRARNIPNNDAYELTKAIEQADQTRKQKSVADYWSQPPKEQGTLREQITPPVVNPCVRVGVPPSDNPCIALYGPGPDGRRCKDCAHFFGLKMSKTYYKCDLRKNTHGSATDHKVRWPACAKFAERAEGDDIPLHDGR